MASKSNKLFSELFGRLMEDVNTLSSARSDSSPIQRRSYVRAVFALIEGTTFAAKQFALESPGSKFTTSEQALLREEEYYLDAQGRARTRRARLTCLANVRLGFAALAKSRDAEFRPKYGGPGWENLRTAVTIRDRLMHPKNTEDLDITDDEMDVVGSAFRWYVASTTLCLKSIVVGLTQRLGTAELDVDKERLDRMERMYPPYAE